MIGKFYFALYLSKIQIKSFLSKLKFKLFGAKIGKDTVMHNTDICGYVNKVEIEEKCILENGVKFIINKEGKISIGKNSLLAYNVVVVAGTGTIAIGKNTMIAANTYIINNDHCIHEKLSVRNSSHIVKDICIGDNVWIGTNCSILKGVKIEEGSIIGAGSVVTKDIPPYSVAFGNPCEVKKFRYSKEVLKYKLLEEGYDIEKINMITNKIDNYKILKSKLSKEALI